MNKTVIDPSGFYKINKFQKKCKGEKEFQAIEIMLCDMIQREYSHYMSRQCFA